MFNFFNRSETRYPTIRQALFTSGLSMAADPTRVAVVEKHGQYVGRRVNFFRAFEPGHQDLLLGSGHVEHEGLVVWDAVRASSSEATLSAPAATWQHARETSAVGVSP